MVVGMRASGSRAKLGERQASAFWPSRYGADDEAGALNELTADNVLRAARLVRHGRVVDLAHVLDERVPAFPGRSFHQHLTIDRDRRVGRNAVNYAVEWVHAPSQIGTHVDGLNHLHDGERMYNGHRLVDVTAEHGTTRLGIETLPQVVTRGVLVDIAALHGVAQLAAGQVITPSEVEAALDATRLYVSPGDAVLFHTGWGTQFGLDNSAYLAGEPGPGMAVAEWLVERRVAITGCDTWSFGPVPAERPDRPFQVPQWMNTRHGLTVIENLRLTELAATGVSEFLFVASHPKLRGATGAWTAPLAIY
jgi:kynurenine formamidase